MTDWNELKKVRCERQGWAYWLRHAKIRDSQEKSLYCDRRSDWEGLAGTEAPNRRLRRNCVRQVLTRVPRYDPQGRWSGAR